MQKPFGAVSVILPSARYPARHIAVFISCLGLFGLVSYTVQQHTKEIGIRKVLGASSVRVAVMLTGDVTRAVAVGVVLGLPISYLMIQRWLMRFSDHIDLGIGLLAASGLLAILIACATVGYQAVRAASADPVRGLRYE